MASSSPIPSRALAGVAGPLDGDGSARSAVKTFERRDWSIYKPGPKTSFLRQYVGALNRMLIRYSVSVYRAGGARPLLLGRNVSALPKPGQGDVGHPKMVCAGDMSLASDRRLRFQLPWIHIWRIGRCG